MGGGIEIMDRHPVLIHVHPAEEDIPAAGERSGKGRGPVVPLPRDERFIPRLEQGLSQRCKPAHVFRYVKEGTAGVEHCPSGNAHCRVLRLPMQRAAVNVKPAFTRRSRFGVWMWALPDAAMVSERWSSASISTILVLGFSAAELSSARPARETAPNAAAPTPADLRNSRRVGVERVMS